MTAPTQYASTDASAPTLSGTVDSLNALLAAILVNGYGSKAAAGWTRPYYDATAKIGCYRPAAGPQHYLQVNDNGPGAGTYKEARIRGYVTMSAYNTGTEPFPTVAQQTNGIFIRKSTTADSTARTWKAVADDSTIHLIIDAADAANNQQLYTFGRIRSWKTSDPYETYISARLTENASTFSTAASPNIYMAAPGLTLTCGYLARSYTALSGAVVATHNQNAALTNATTSVVMGTVGQTYPNPVDGGLLLTPLYIMEGTIPRGVARGLWIPAHPKPILDGDTFTASDGATTRTFQAYNISTAGQILIETSNTWDTE